MENEEVTISMKEYQDLLRDSKILEALYCAGVDNWDGYEYALEELHSNEEE